MDTAQRRVIGLVAVASWLLIDSVRTAGPLLSELFDAGLLAAVGAALGAFAVGGLLAWAAALAGRHFGHGIVLLFLLAATGILRLGLPWVAGGWLVAAGLYVLAFAVAGVVLATRTALGNGGPGVALAATALGGAAAVVEQTVLRTWDAVWRDDLLGWLAMGGLALLAIVNGWRCRDLEPVASSRGWWAYGLYWSLLVYAFANVAWVNAQTGLRMSGGAAIAIVSLCVGAALAGQVRAVSRLTMVVLAATGAIALVTLLLWPGTAATMALPIAVGVATLATAQVLRPQDSSPARRLGAAVVFSLLIILPVMLVQLDYDVPLRVPHVSVIAVAGIAVMGAAAWRAWRGAAASPVPGVAPGVAPRVAGGILVAVLVSAWTYVTYELPRTYSADFIVAPRVMTWNVHYGVTPGMAGGPHVDLDDVAATIDESEADVVLLQEVDRGWILAGGTDVLEYLAGELHLPYAYAPAHDPQYGNVVMTSRPHDNVRSTSLPYGEGPQRRSAVAVDFMGATFVSTHLQSKDSAQTRVEQATALVEWLDAPGPVVVGGDFNDVPESPTFAVMADAGFASAQDVFSRPEDTYVGADFQGRIDYLFGRDVEFTEFTLGVAPWSDHFPLAARVVTGAQPPTDAEPSG